MSSAAEAPRTALLAGATGLIGRALLPLLLAHERYAALHVLVRRPLPDAPASPKLHSHVVDFARLPPLDIPLADRIDDVFITLGTTIKVAGSEAAFRQVDFDFALNTARAAKAAGARRCAVVSALGADAASRVFYNRVKGEAEAELARLGFDSLNIAQPSLLVGDRAALGQPVRTGEVWVTRLLSPVMGLVPASVRPIRAEAVARALLAACLAGRPGVQVLTSAAMQGAGAYA
jgi:uncharacterized protein YbjT (DUF2867 family)